VVAGAVALAVHAAFDFVWHLPVIPLSVAALIGLAASGPAWHGTATRAEPAIVKGEA
jgi:hypothetical protein